MRSVAPRIQSSRSALSRLLLGQVQSPDMRTVLELRKLAERRNPAGTVSEEDLRRLLQRAQDEDQADAEEPADLPAHAARRSLSVPGTGAPHVAPVHAAEGDRRNDSTADALWPIDEFVGHLDNGRYEHIVAMLDYAGGKAPAIEAAAAIRGCSSRGLNEATDTLLRKVASRPGDFVLAVVGHLMDAGNFPEARTLAQMRGGDQAA